MKVTSFNKKLSYSIWTKQHHTHLKKHLENSEEVVQLPLLILPKNIYAHNNKNMSKAFWHNQPNANHFRFHPDWKVCKRCIHNSLVFSKLCTQYFGCTLKLSNKGFYLNIRFICHPYTKEKTFPKFHQVIFVEICKNTQVYYRSLLHTSRHNVYAYEEWNVSTYWKMVRSLIIISYY